MSRCAHQVGRGQALRGRHDAAPACAVGAVRGILRISRRRGHTPRVRRRRRRERLRLRGFDELRRLLADERSQEFVKNFAGQWLQTRDVESVSIDARIVQARDAGSEQALDFTFDEVREARLVPVVDFKGRRFAAPPVVPVDAVETDRNEVDGDRKP